VRGAFTSKVKEAIHFIFGNELPHINSQATPSQIQGWKNKPEVKRCFARLFKKIKADQSTTYVEKITKRLRDPSKTQIAYAISICETYLDPSNQVIQMKEGLIKEKIIKNLVSLNLSLQINAKHLN
jgi:hypothetical protein